MTLSVSELAGDDEPLSIVAPLNGAPSWVTLDGTDHPTSLTASPPGNAASGTYAFSVTVQDPGGLTAIANVSLTISNLAPTAIADNYFTDVTDLAYTVPDPTANDIDPDGDPLTVQTASVISGPGSIVTVVGNSIVVFLPHGDHDPELHHRRQRRPHIDIDDHDHIQPGADDPTRHREHQRPTGRTLVARRVRTRR